MAILKKLFLLTTLGLTIQLNLHAYDMNSNQKAEISNFIKMLNKENSAQTKDIAQWLNIKTQSSDDIEPLIKLTIINTKLSLEDKILFLMVLKKEETNKSRTTIIDAIKNTLGTLAIIGLMGYSAWLRYKFNEYKEGWYS